MKYRPFGNLDWQVSVLGFGAMRLPVVDKDQSKIDEPEAIKMIRHAIDNGVNYVDTAYPYHGGHSEALVAKALQDGYREKVKLATKMPSWFIQKPEDFDRFLGEQLERLQTDCIEFYLLHGMNKDQWPKLRDLGVLDWAEKAKADGRIQYLGFSFHDDYEIFKEIIDAYAKWDFCQIQYNFMDTEFQAGTKGLKYATEKGVAVVVMEPLRGGQLTKEPPESVARIWANATTQRSQADWALQWIWNQPEVPVVLSGMTTMRHVEENLASADRSEIGLLNKEELDLVDQVRQEYLNKTPVLCTECNYCIPCPNEVNIPRIIKLYNEGMIFDDHRRARYFYRQIPEANQGNNCDACHECEEVCPQEIMVSEWMEEIHGWLGPKKN
ncbi:MAG: aldo/keto reductase [Proteobacteria bacterium]|nr:aldo/keto reductase [Pseudomonadota bacterium]